MKTGYELMQGHQTTTIIEAATRHWNPYATREERAAFMAGARWAASKIKESFAAAQSPHSTGTNEEKK